MKRIKVVCAKSWGKLGNYNSARRVAEYVERTLPNSQVTVEPLEEIWPQFAQWGQEMQDAAAHLRPEDVSREFRRINGSIARELAKDAVTLPVLQKLQQTVLSSSDACIGTKGIISGLLCDARRASGRDIPVLNWVTNPGLIDIPIHACPDADGHFVPLQEDAEKLCRRMAANPDAVHAVGPPISLAQISAGMQGGAAPEKTKGYALVFYFHFLEAQCLEVVKDVMSIEGEINAFVFYATMDPSVQQATTQLEADCQGRLKVCRACKQ
uniref:hypothetical protein n=1 Tax=Shimia ponticola TaxID=2582893 RepID=UPI0011BEBA6E